MSEQEIQISGEPTMDPQVCKFIVSVPVLENGSLNCKDAKMAGGSPLLEGLFAIEGVSQILVSGTTLTIAKTNDVEWKDIGQKIGSVIREVIRSGKEPINMDMLKKTPDEEAIKAKIEHLFTASINPQIASHGGFVELADVDGTTVFLRLGGGCQGCASSSATLKLGIEKAIMEVVPEVTEVVDVTDHASGVNPYYQ